MQIGFKIKLSMISPCKVLVHYLRSQVLFSLCSNSPSQSTLLLMVSEQISGHLTRNT